MPPTERGLAVDFQLAGNLANAEPFNHAFGVLDVLAFHAKACHGRARPDIESPLAGFTQEPLLAVFVSGLRQVAAIAVRTGLDRKLGFANDQSALNVLLAPDDVWHDDQQILGGQHAHQGSKLRQIYWFHGDSQPGYVLAHAIHITLYKANPFTGPLLKGNRAKEIAIGL